MEKKVIFIKLKQSDSCKSIIDRFEESYNAFVNKIEIGYRYYNFGAGDANDLIDEENYYFFALVYKVDPDESEKYVKVFLGTGKFSKYNNSISFVVKYKSELDNAIRSLIASSSLDLDKDFGDHQYVSRENSESLFSQIDTFLSDPYIPETHDGEYGHNDLENNLHELAQKNEYCRRQYNLRGEQKGRGEFQRDYERIVHSKAFRRMVDKAQVFSASKGDYYRTRMTHSQAVAQIARGIATELNLNLNLTEAIALGHDLGHTPFGHQGERTLNDILQNEKIHIINNADLFEDHFGGFKHNFQSVRVASILEDEYFEIEGMDLSYQTLEGMLKHTSFKKKNFKFDLKEFIRDKNAEENLHFDSDVCSTLEGQIVAVADEIAQRGHDLDDALSSGMISIDEFRKSLDLNKLSELKNKIDPLLDHVEEVEGKGRIFPDKSELINTRVVSAVLSYFINDVINESRNRMNKYSVDTFKEDNYTVKERLIWFSDNAESINTFLETLIANRVINSPEVSLFDSNGSTIVAGLFKAYYRNPRLIHRGTQRRIYAETRLHTKNVVDFELGDHNVIRDEIHKITMADLSDDSDDLTPELKEEYKLKRKILVRNICDYIAGMTDTYAINEYRRIEK